MKRKILIVENSPGMTGAFRSIAALVEALQDEFDFHFAIPRRSLLAEELTRRHLPFALFSFYEIRKNLIDLVLYVPMLIFNAVRLNRYCRRHEITVVHVNDLYNMTGVLVKLMNPRIVLVYHVRLLRSSYARSLYFLWIKIISIKADAMVAVSKTVLSQVKEIITNSVPVVVIYDFVPLSGRTTTRPLSGPITFLYPANYISGKGHEAALKAFIQVAKGIPGIRLIMAGGDLGMIKNRRLKNRLRAYVEKGGYSHLVSVQDKYNNLVDKLNEAHVVLMFSESESFSMVCYESMFYGVPVIATRCGGPEELIEDRVSGLLVKNGDSLEMENGIRLLATDTGLREALGRNAAELIRARIQAESPVEALRALYCRLLPPVTSTANL